MKLMTKLLYGLALIFGIIGGAFCIVSLCFGFGSGEFSQIVDSGRNFFQEKRFVNEGVRLSELKNKNADFTETYQGIDKLDIDVSTAECLLVPYDGDEWIVSGYELPDNFKCKKSGSSLQIKIGDQRFMPWKLFGNKMYLEIMVPADVVLDRFKLDCGVGAVSMENGMLICKKADIECGVGSCELNMDIRDELSIECGVGDVTLLLGGEKEDFAYKLECGIGEIQLGDSTYSALGVEYKTEATSVNESGLKVNKSIKASCGVGSVTIDFAGSDS